MTRSGAGGLDLINEFMNPNSDFRSGRFTNKLLNRATTIQKTMDPRDLQAMCVSAYALFKGGQPDRQIGPYVLYAQTPTLLLYYADDIYVVAVRGTQGPLSGEDWSANSTIPFQGLAFTNRWMKDLSTIRQWKSQFPGGQWYATGHSLGGAICDELLRNGFVKEAFTFNPAVQPKEQTNVSLLKNNRVYTLGDPLYTLFGVQTIGAKLVPPENLNQALLHLTDPLYSHSLKSFDDSSDAAVGMGKKERKHPPRFVRDQCWFNAAHNIRYYKEHEELDLHWVVGSQRFWGSRAEDEWGGVGFYGIKHPDGSKEIFPLDNDLKKARSRFSSTHSWLEDDEGNVYDMIYPEDLDLFKQFKHPIVDWHMEPGLIEGVPRAELAMKGYELTPFSLPAQRIILEKLIDNAEEVEEEEVEEWLRAVALPEVKAEEVAESKGKGRKNLCGLGVGMTAKSHVVRGESDRALTLALLQGRAG